MTKKKIWIISLAIIAAAVIYYLVQFKQQKVSILIVNGNIYTLDSNNTVVQAAAVQNDLIVGTGTNEEMKVRFSPDIVIDLKGKTVVPGLIDGHCHVLGIGGKLQTLDLVDTKSIDEITGLVRKHCKELQPGQWLIGRGWDQNDWQIKIFPDHYTLDRVSPNNPVLLRRIDGHAVWLNLKAMETAGITRKTKEPVGGKIYRDEKGNPSGILVDNAMELIDKVVPSLTENEIEQRLKLALNECAEFGLTEVHDMGVDLQTIGVYKRLIDRGECPIRVYAAIGDLGETWKHYLKSGREIGYGNGLLTIRSLKLYIDGALGSRGAALIEEYSDAPGDRGLTMMSETQMDSLCREAMAHGFQVCTHSIGDRGNYIVLNVYGKLLKTLPTDGPSLRWRIEHCQVLQSSDIPRFRELGILPSMQPTHATSDMYWAVDRLGPERAKGAYAWRSILKTGAHIIGGSDSPVEAVNPLFGIYAACTRQDKNENPSGGWYGDQKMSREEAVRSFTDWAAYGAFEENRKGTITIGKEADFTVLSKDIMKIPPKEILTTEVDMTIVGGKVVYKRQ